MKLIRIAEYFSRDQQSRQIEQKPAADAAKRSAVDSSESNRGAEEAVRVASSIRQLPVQESGSTDGARAQRIAELAKAVRSGNYKPDAGAVASKVYVDLF